MTEIFENVLNMMGLAVEKEETFICSQCQEETEEDYRAENSYEAFGEYDLCEECYQRYKEDMR